MFFPCFGHQCSTSAWLDAMPQVVAFAVADDVLLCQAIEFAEIHAEIHRLVVDLVQIGGVREIVLADLEEMWVSLPEPAQCQPR